MAVYGFGLFSGVLENDSAQFSVMAMRMVQEGDYWSLYKGNAPYLDKPHLHYWLAAASYAIFGIAGWSYKLPGILALFLAAFSVYKLGKLLYNTQVGRAACLIFLSAQTIVLSGIDVRTDAVLTGFVGLALWQFIAFVNRPDWKTMGVGALATALAFSTKGHLALVMIGFPLLGHLFYTKKLTLLLKKEVFFGLFIFVLGITPILYAYFLQFDMHPELVIRGKTNRSGVFFILFEQSFERMSGTGVGTNSPDYFFFFHTFLWAFLPFTPAALYMVLKRFSFYKIRTIKPDQGLWYGLVAVVLLISFAQFKLPHYLNSSMGLWAVLTAGALGHWGNQSKPLRYVLSIQRFVYTLLIITAMALVFYVFPPQTFIGYVVLFVPVLLLAFWTFTQKSTLRALWVGGVVAAVIANGIMNLSFYPALLKYQAGTTMAQKIKEARLETNTIYKWGEAHSWAMDFGLQQPLKSINTQASVATLSSAYLYVSESQLLQLKTAKIPYRLIFTVPKYRITRLKWAFLNPNTREAELEKMFLVHLD